MEVLPWGPTPPRRPQDRRTVSILVLVEVLPWALAYEFPQPGRKFQSLFWWKYCPGSASLGSLIQRPVRFNPCSGGSIALGSQVSLGKVLGREFQSLFWWKYCPGCQPDHGRLPVGPQFQSLFWWKYCPGRPREQTAQYPRHPVSILVLVEVLPWEWLALVGSPTSTLFQSLFWWKYCPGQALCSHLLNVPPAVSILVLVEVLPWVRRRQAEYYIAHVSILVLVEVLPWDRAHGEHQLARAMFQSLFWWKYCPGNV